MKRPLLVTTTAPVAVNVLFTANVVPRSVADPTETVLVNIVAPVAAFVCVRAPLIAMAPPNVAAPEFVTVTAVKPFTLLTPPAPNKSPTLKAPTPELKVRVLAASTVPFVEPVIVIAAPALEEAVVSRRTLAATITLSVIVIALPSVIILSFNVVVDPGPIK